MATTAIAVTSSWVSVLEGPAEINLQNLMQKERIQYAALGSEPAATFKGALLEPGVMHPVAVSGDEELYVRFADAVPAGFTGAAVAVDA